MFARLTVLASGSAGNSALVELDDARLLIDAGLSARDLEDRLGKIGVRWPDLSGVLMTHRHTDHWKPTALAKLAEHRVPLFAHRDHLPAFRAGCRGFEEIERAKLVRVYVTNRPIALCAAWNCRPFRVRHDAGATFGFRFDRIGILPLAPPLEGEEKGNAIGKSGNGSFAYVADLGCWDDDVVSAISDVELLALEFNHDRELLQASARPPWVIHRVLSDDGHLSNSQAADLLRRVLRQSSAGQLRQVVLLHLSQECNRPHLALAAAKSALADHDSSAALCVAEQDQPTPTFVVGHVSNVPTENRAR